MRKKDKDHMFAKSLCNDMRSLEKQFGPDALNYVSMDDKAKVPIGLAAAKCQTPLLMHVEYKVKVIFFMLTNEHYGITGN